MRKYWLGIVLVGLCTPALSLAYTPSAAQFTKDPFLLSASQMAAVLEATSTSPVTNIQPVNKNTADLIALSRPAVVRIIYKLVGTTTIPDFTFDTISKTWVPFPTGKPLPLPYNLYASGSGFIISPNGYILTNSHVVSTAEVKQELAQEVMSTYALDLLFSKGSTSTYVNKLSSDDFDAWVKSGEAYIESTMSPIGTPSIVVVKPSLQIATTTSVTTLQSKSDADSQKELDAIIAQGIPATVAYVNDQFMDDEKDFAVIKIAKSNLPSVALGDSDSVQVGQPIYVLGSPANADYSSLDDQSTFTSGSINSRKNSTQNTFQYLQTDAKTSPGSSGSPLFDTSAHVVGIVTEDSANESGDSFAFALPINLTKTEIAQLNISTSSEIDYPSLMSAGFMQLQAQHCKAALQDFNAAASMDTTFGGTAQYVQPYIDQCNALIANGKSIDSPLDVVRIWIETRNLVTWTAIGGGVLALCILIFFLYFLLKKLRKDDQIIEKLEHEMHPGTIQPVAQPVVQSVAGVPANVQMRAFVVQSRAAGQTGDQIRTALMSAGWKPDDITRAMQ